MKKLDNIQIKETKEEEDVIAKVNREFILEKGYGAYRIILLHEYRFNLEKNTGGSIKSSLDVPVLRATKKPGAEYRIEDRMIHGIHRRYRDLDGEIMSLEIIHDFNAIIPYKAISYIEKIAELPF